MFLLQIYDNNVKIFKTNKDKIMKKIEKMKAISEIVDQINVYQMFKSGKTEFTNEKLFLAVQNKILKNYLNSLKPYGFKNKSKIQSVEELLNSTEFAEWFKPYKRPIFVKDVYTIFCDAFTPVEEIVKNPEKYLEAPVKDGVLALIDKGYNTVLSSANYKNVSEEEKGKIKPDKYTAYIAIKQDLPKSVAENKVFEKGAKPDEFFLFVDITPDSLVTDVSQKFMELIYKLPDLNKIKYDEQEMLK